MLIIMYAIFVTKVAKFQVRSITTCFRTEVNKTSETAAVDPHQDQGVEVGLYLSVCSKLACCLA